MAFDGVYKVHGSSPTQESYWEVETMLSLLATEMSWSSLEERLIHMSSIFKNNQRLTGFLMLKIYLVFYLGHVACQAHPHIFDAAIEFAAGREQGQDSPNGE